MSGRSGFIALRAPSVSPINPSRFGRRAAVACAALLGLSTIASAAAANSCLDPATHWPDTLYCQYGGGVPAAPPPLPATPTTPAQLQDYWLHFLTPRTNVKGDPIRCLDGTRPAMWVDKATDGTNDIESNRWLITFLGGGSCNETLGGRTCVEDYDLVQERDEMSTATIPLRTKSFEGLLSTGPANAFRGYNRVQVHKCSYDRFNGFSLSSVTDTHPVTMAPITYDLYQQGFSIAKSALLDLQNGLVYEQYVPDGAGGVVAQDVTLPPLADAETVIFYGHSGAAHGLMHNIDRFADILGDWDRTDGDDFSGDVRAVFDANFAPAPEAEPAHWSPPGGDVWDQIVSGTTASGADFDYSDATFQPGGDYYNQLAEWDSLLDQSCWEAHPLAADRARCRDRYHVLFHHVTTPFFIRQDLEDRNSGHVNHGLGHRVSWSTGAPFAVMTPADYADRVSRQMTDLMGGSTMSELSLLCDPAADQCDTSGLFPTFFAIGPSCSFHPGFLSNAQIQTEMEEDATGTRKSFHDLLLDFLALPRSGAGVHMIDGAGYSTRNCPP